MMELIQARRRENEKRRDVLRKDSSIPHKEAEGCFDVVQSVEAEPLTLWTKAGADGPEPGLMRRAEPNMMQTCTAGCGQNVGTRKVLSNGTAIAAAIAMAIATTIAPAIAAATAKANAAAAV